MAALFSSMAMTQEEAPPGDRLPWEVSVTEDAVLSPGGIARLSIAESGFVFDPVDGQSYTVNESGRFILKQLLQGVTRTALLTALSKAFETTPSEIERDTIDFINRLKEMFR